MFTVLITNTVIVHCSHISEISNEQMVGIVKIFLLNRFDPSYSSNIPKHKKRQKENKKKPSLLFLTKYKKNVKFIVFNRLNSHTGLQFWRKKAK